MPRKKPRTDVVLNDIGKNELQNIQLFLKDGEYFNCIEVRPEMHYLHLVLDMSDLF